MVSANLWRTPGYHGYFAIHGAVGGSLASRLPAISDQLHLSPGALGIALLMPAVGGLISMPFAGRVVHRLGVRTATRLLVALWRASLALPALTGNLWSLAAVFLIYGAAAGTSDVAMNAQGVAVEGRLGRSIMSSLHGLWSVGGFIGSVPAHSWRRSGLTTGCMCWLLLDLLP